MEQIMTGPPDAYLYPGIIDIKVLAPDRVVAILAARWTTTAYDAPLSTK